MANKLDGTGKKLEVIFCLERSLLVSEVHELISLLLKGCKTKGIIRPSEKWALSFLLVPLI